MISLILVVIWIAVLLYFSYKYLFDRPENFPPGPPKVPWFGSYIFMLMLNHKHLHFAVDRICEFYKSTVIGLHLGSFPTIIINDLANLKKSLYHRDFDGRPDILFTQMRHPDFVPMHGIFFSEGELWHEQRRFALRHLRDYGFGRRFDSLEKEIEIQIKQFIDMVKNGPKYEHEKKYVKQGRVLMPQAFGPTLGNCFLACLLNAPLPRENMADLTRAVDNAFIFHRALDDYGKLFSIIENVAKWFPVLSGFKAGRESSVELFDVYKKVVDEQIKTYDASHERHFIDMYIKKMRSREANPDEKTYFTYEQLVLTCVDFSFASVSAVPTTIAFLFQQMLLEPGIQRKVQNEIDQVVGHGRAPTLDDRVNLPYTEACIREIMRYETLVPSGTPHKALVDTKFSGYTIPKGTVIVTALNAAMHDPTAWDRPNEFWPERFLDLSGKLCLSKDISLPFGAGRRLCAGETFTRNMLFLCITTFLQAFTIRMADGRKPLKFSENLTGTIRTPKDFWIEVTAR